MSGNTAESGFTPRRLVIVGCRGRMGALLSARWSAAGHTVAGLDLPLTDEAFAEALPGADAVFLCIPAGAMAEVLPHLVPHLDGRQILADITSVKMQPLGQMERAYAGPVVGTHPLFGLKPQPSDLRVNFYKLCDGERPHYGSFYPTDFTAVNPLGSAFFGDFELAEY